MKRALLILFLPFVTHAADTRAIYQPQSKCEVTFASEGEDATSTFYYFFYKLPGVESLAKVRMLWNGGGQNKPSITDYYLDGSSIFIVERSAERHDLAMLLNGEDAPFETLREHTIKGIGDDAATVVSKDERAALRNLVSILAMTRKPVPKTSR